MDNCAKSKPDGYTLCITTSAPVSQHPWMVANLPYDPQKDLSPIMRIGAQPSGFVVHPSVQATNVKELLELARSKPETLSWASSGIGSSGHLYYEWLRSINVPFYHVPYKTIDQALIGTINGDVQVLIHSLSTLLPHVKAGKLKLLAAGMEERTRVMPDVASGHEQGFEVGMSLWIGAFAPARTPRDVIARLNTEFNRALESDEGRKRLGARGIEAAGGSAEQFAEFLRIDFEKSGRLVKLAGIKPQ